MASQPPVGADLSCPPPIYRPFSDALYPDYFVMYMHTIPQISVGADLSCPPPIYRPWVPQSLSRVFCESSLSALPGYPYPDYFVNVHNCTITSI
jgi:hypothetical protein